MLHRVAQPPAVLVGREPAERLGGAPLPEPPHPGVELGEELLEPLARPVPRVEELALERAEEALHARVVWAAALARHRPREPVGLADRGPARPAVVPPAVGVDGRPLAGRERGARGLQARVREGRRGPGAARPGDGAPVEAVDDGAEVGPLAGGEAELGDVGDPQLVRRGGGEVVRPVGAQRQVRRGRGGLARVGAPAPSPAPGGREALLAHDAPHDLLGDARAAPPQLGPHGAVAAAAAHLGEQRPDLGPQPGVLVGAEAGPVVLIGAAGASPQVVHGFSTKGAGP